MDLFKLFSAYKGLLDDDGLAVTLNETQTIEMICSAGLAVYAFFSLYEDCRLVSFVKI